MQATHIKDVSANFNGEAHLYKVTPKAPYEAAGGKKRNTSYLVSSAASAMGRPETYIFPANRTGRVLDWLELDGSASGYLDCDRAIRDAGYELEATK